jgi:Tol biopolymer transport system component
VAPNAQGQLVSGPPVRHSVTAVPLDAPTRLGQAIPLVGFVAQVGEPGRVTDNLLREQFSPDGRRLVLSVFSSDAPDARMVLVIVDLVAGTVSELANDPAFDAETPAWSPRGDLIAFTRRPTTSRAASELSTIWVVRPDGSGLRQVPLPAPRVPELVCSWNGDGSRLAFMRGYDALPYELVDPATGSTSRVTDKYGGCRRLGDWRDAASAAFVGFFVDSAFPPGGDGHLVTTDQRGGSASVVLTESTPNAFFRDPRWRPNTNDILYVRASYDASNRHLTNSLLVTDASGRTPRAFATSALLTMLAACAIRERDRVRDRGGGRGERLPARGRRHERAAHPGLRRGARGSGHMARPRSVVVLAVTTVRRE